MSTSLQGDRPGALAVFTFQGGPQYRQELPVPSPVVTVGRGAQCDVVLSDDSVSAVHARLEYDAGRWRLTDLESTNGTTVEGVRLAPNVPTPVHYGMSMRFGGVAVLFREVEDANVDEARAAYVAPPAATTLKEERAGFRFPVWLLVVIVALLVVLGLFLFRRGATAQPAADAPVSAPAHPAAPRAGP